VDNSSSAEAEVVALIWSQHPCDRRHRKEAAFIKCAIPKLEWVDGEGPYACIAWCRVPTATLWATYSEALRAKRDIDYRACGGRCTRRHQIVRIVLPT
jgi:hypothetical protein